MYEVAHSYTMKAVGYLKELSSIRKVFEDKETSTSVEIYPEIMGYLDGGLRADPSIQFLDIYGPGVNVLAFLMQEGVSNSGIGVSNCGKCEKQPNCRLAHAGWIQDGSHRYISSERVLREKAEDFLQFLRTKYPMLYIPKYRTEETELSWVDLLVDLSREMEIWLFSGTVKPDNPCRAFVQE